MLQFNRRIIYEIKVNLQFPSNAIIIKNKVFLPQAKVTIADFGGHVQALWYLFQKLLQLFGFPIIDYERHLLEVISETRRAQQVRHQCFYYITAKPYFNKSIEDEMSDQFYGIRTTDLGKNPNNRFR